MHSKTITEGGFIGVLIKTISKVFTLINRKRWFKCLGVSCTLSAKASLKACTLCDTPVCFPHHVPLGKAHCHNQNPSFYTAAIVFDPCCRDRVWDARYLRINTYEGNERTRHSKKMNCGISPVAWWIRICLPMQQTRVQSLAWEDPTCHRAAKPVRQRFWALAPESELHSKRSHLSEKPTHRS